MCEESKEQQKNGMMSWRHGGLLLPRQPFNLSEKWTRFALKTTVSFLKFT